MYRIAHRILILLLTISLIGCGAGRPVKYYTIPLVPPPAHSANPYPISLLVATISAPEILHDTPIAYRVGANEIGTYQYSRWVEPPIEMLRGKLIRTLSGSGNYQSVNGTGSKSEGQFVVRGRLYEFEEVDSGSIAGLVSMEFELFDRKSGKVVWSHFYSQSEPAQGKGISAVVTALDLNLDRGLNEVVAGLNQYFSATLATKS